MKIVTTLAMMLGMSILGACSARAADLPPADQFVSGKVSALADTLGAGSADQRHRLRDEVRAIADFDGFAARALGAR